MKNPLVDFYAKRTAAEKKALWIAAAIVGLSLVDRLILIPVTTTLSNLNTNIREQETSIRKSMNVLLHKDRIVADSRETMAYSVEAKSPEEEMVGLLREVESIAENAGVSLVYVKPANTKEENGVKKYYCNLECEAPMEQVATFFHDLENSTRLLKLEKYQIQPKAKDSSIARCTVSVYKTVLS